MGFAPSSTISRSLPSADSRSVPNRTFRRCWWCNGSRDACSTWFGSVGHVTRQCVEAYVADQLGHHRMADPRIQARFAQYQIERPDVDLSQPQKTSHGIYWYNLHVVLVHRERWMEVREDVLQRVHDMIVRVCEGNGYRLSRAGILADHVHLVLGCPIQVAPDEVVLGFLNNLAFAQDLRPIYQFGGFVGTVGEYTTNAW